MDILLSIAMIAVLAADPQPVPVEQPAGDEAAPQLAIGLVVGTDVYVRSGPSTNYYPVTRLSADQRVVVYDVQHGWMSIAPPKGAHSLVGKEFVDLDDNGMGIINAEQVWVHIGSDLSESRYAKQSKLAKGAAVKLLGEVEGFYKIEPPEGAKLWISADYVKIVGPYTGQQANVDDSPVSGLAQVATQEQPPLPPPTDKIDSKHLRQAIDKIEVDLKEEFKKGVFERDLKPFVVRFQRLAEQHEGQVAKLYAEYRIKQLNNVTQHAVSLKELEVLRAQWETQRDRFREERENLRPPLQDLTREFSVRGQLVISAAYSNPAGVRRYRLVDPDSSAGSIARTIAYVDIEPQSQINVEEFIGRFVGVRARGRRLLEGSVDQIVVYIAAEIVILEEMAEGDHEPQ